eukprot:CAMPEP_0170540528 /NCGR_PEP_ID=MMETSP0211-20121228/518_1 /TAXON_ID=311385 /ORGANISM="Pseudokeronopsis sp., Strain OXSARD2" /LENGTH=242 /DNA_ID=CAMNT_0010842971 /DNA_START=106 /DNA_END=831 /DNA_ORIENTATION=-
MALSNYLLLQWRERLLLESKVNQPEVVMKSGTRNPLTKDFNQKSLQQVATNIEDGTQSLLKLLYVGGSVDSLPVAFASNALYVLERGGSGDREFYDKVILPVLRNKIEFLHGDGVAHTVWALSKAQIWDTSIWEGLKKHIKEKNFNVQFVKNQRWSAGLFETHAGNEHFFEGEVNSFAHELFFQDKLSLYELYNGLVAANSQSNLDLGESLKLVEQRYKEHLQNNAEFQQIEEAARDEGHGK